MMNRDRIDRYRHMANTMGFLQRINPRRLLADAQGIAAVEFAMIVPLMVTLFFGIVEFSQAMASNRKVNYAATMLVDLVSQEQFLSEDDINGIYTAVEQVLEPYGIDNPTMWVTSITIDEDDKPIVDWSLKKDLSEPFARGSEFTALSEDELDLSGDDALITEGSSLIVAYIQYPFTSSLANVMIETITFENHATRWPRRSSNVVYCDGAGDCSDD